MKYLTLRMMPKSSELQISRESKKLKDAHNMNIRNIEANLTMNRCVLFPLKSRNDSDSFRKISKYR